MHIKHLVSGGVSSFVQGSGPAAGPGQVVTPGTGGSAVGTESSFTQATGITALSQPPTPVRSGMFANVRTRVAELRDDMRTARAIDAQAVVDARQRALSRPTPTEKPLYHSEPLKRLLALPGSLLRARRIIKSELADDRLHEVLYSFWGFHHQNEVGHYQRRNYLKVPKGDIAKDQLMGMSPDEFVAIAQFAMEIEIPVHRYSEQSGKSLGDFWNLLAQFMGRTEEEQQAYSQELAANPKQREKCRDNGGWCAEEFRHGQMLAIMIEAITGEPANLDNADQYNIAYRTEKGAIKHIYDRMGTEWGASSAYFVLASHCRGPLRRTLMNVLRDEIKHLVIFSAAGVYLHGRRPWHRLGRMLVRIWREYNVNRRSRTDGNEVASSPFLLLEVVYTHLLVEKRMRQFLKTLPMRTLVRFFETKSQVPPLEEIELDTQALAQRGQQRDGYDHKKATLGYWTPKQRAAEEQKRKIEGLYSREIDAIEKREFQNFNSAEVPQSAFANQALMDIESLTFKYIQQNYFPDDPIFYQRSGLNKKQVIEQIKEILTDRLLDFQIQNNLFEMLRVAAG